MEGLLWGEEGVCGGGGSGVGGEEGMDACEVVWCAVGGGAEEVVCGGEGTKSGREGCVGG